MSHAHAGGRRIRGGGRGARGAPQASLPSNILNAEELENSGIKVDILKELMMAALNSTEDVEEGDKASKDPPKLLNFDEVIVRGEDVTG